MRYIVLILLALSALATAACQTPIPTQRIPRAQWLLLPLAQPESMKSTPREVQGWWLGARTIRQNPRAGEQVADLLARRLAVLDYVNLYSPIDLSYYFVDKRAALSRQYPYLTPVEIDRLLAEVPPVKFGQELDADRILTGRIIQLHMAENRTIHWWWAVAELELQVINVADDQVVWTRHYYERDQFASMSTVLEKIVDQAIKDLQHEVFLPQAR